MGKVRHVELGDEKAEKEQKKKAEVRREAKKAKKQAENAEVTDIAAETTPKEDAKPEKTEKKHEESKVKTRSNRYLAVSKLVDRNMFYPLSEAINLVKKTSLTKFDGTVEAHININANTLKDPKEAIRGTVNLPHGTGKQVRVLVADEAVIADIEAGKFNFDILVAHPSMMPKLAKVARILGPKGLMPNPKTGTVTTDPEKKVKELSSGLVNYKSEPDNPIIHMSVGKVSFEAKQLSTNIEAVIEAIGKAKIEKLTLSSTMGPGIKVNLQ